MGLFICPICGEKLGISGKSYRCPKNHNFDMAKSGYLNLLVSKRGTVHGDNKIMLRARRDFLGKGYYSPLREAVCRTVGEYVDDESVLLDAGCGEGYYTGGIREGNGKLSIFGLDISKEAVEMAAKRYRNISFLVASVFDIPVESSSVDVLLTMFAPYCGEEYRRVLKDGGYMVMVIPSENHLWELKEAVYDSPYRNRVKPYTLEGFRHVSAERINFRIKLENSADIQNLFSMTPYFYRTGKAEQERLRELDFLETQADFEILTYQLRIKNAELRIQNL